MSSWCLFLVVRLGSLFEVFEHTYEKRVLTGGVLQLPFLDDGQIGKPCAECGGEEAVAGCDARAGRGKPEGLPYRRDSCIVVDRDTPHTAAWRARFEHVTVEVLGLERGHAAIGVVAHRVRVVLAVRHHEPDV